MATNVDAETTPLTLEKQLILRRQWKGAITRHIGTLEWLMAEGDISKVKPKLLQMHNTFDTLDAVHWDYIGSLTEEADWVEQEQWFREIESAYISSVKSARMWLSVKEPPITATPDSVKPDVKPDSSSCSPQATVHPSNDADPVSNLVTLLNLPKVEIDCFDGNPRDYQ